MIGWPCDRDQVLPFDEFYAPLEDEARAEGPGAILDLRANEVKYALINTTITRRQAQLERKQVLRPVYDHHQVVDLQVHDLPPDIAPASRNWGEVIGGAIKAHEAGRVVRRSLPAQGRAG